MGTNRRLPLATCLMVTRDRPHFVQQSLRYFNAQKGADCELLIVDDGVSPAIDLMHVPPRVRFIHLDHPATIGQKRNIGCEAAHGDVIVHWDDDDWHASHRVQHQVTQMVDTGADLCGLRTLLYLDVRNARTWWYTCPSSQRAWLAGNSLCYKKAFWRQNPFPAIQVGEDLRFVSRGLPHRRLVLTDTSILVGVIHSSNVSPKKTRGRCWRPLPLEAVQAHIGGDWAFYEALATSRHR